jgi:hypothetical protein
MRRPRTRTPTLRCAALGHVRFRVRERCDEPSAQARLGTDKDQRAADARHAATGSGEGRTKLGWRPAPVHDSIRRSAEFDREHRRKLKAA